MDTLTRGNPLTVKRLNPLYVNPKFNVMEDTT